MASNVISFKLPDQELQAELERRRQRAGDESVNLYTKRILIEHLTADDRPEPAEVLGEQLDELTRTVLASIESQKTLAQQLEAVVAGVAEVADAAKGVSPQAHSPDLPDELRFALGRIAVIALTQGAPMPMRDAITYVRDKLGVEYIAQPLLGGPA